MLKKVAKQIKENGYKTKVINGLGGKTVNGQFFGHIFGKRIDKIFNN